MTDRLTYSQIIERLTERGASHPAVPSFGVSQVKAVGGATVIEWDVKVPVCEEFPTSTAAFKALQDYAAKMQRLFPPVTNGAAK